VAGLAAAATHLVVVVPLARPPQRLDHQRDPLLPRPFHQHCGLLEGRVLREPRQLRGVVLGREGLRQAVVDGGAPVDEAEFELRHTELRWSRLGERKRHG